MKQAMLALLIFCTGLSKAQDLIIHYNFITDSFWYEKNGRAVNKPTVKKNYEVKVMVENLNPFVFVARCEWEEAVIEEESNISGIAGMFSGFGAATDLLSGFLSGANLEAIDIAANREGISMFSDNESARMDLESTFRCYNRLFAVEQTILRSEQAAARLKKLKFNPYMPADTLKKVADMMVIHALNPLKKKNFSITATTFLNKSGELSVDLIDQYNQLRNSAEHFLEAYNTFSNRNGSSFNEVGMDRTVRDMLASARELTANYKADDINENIEALEVQYNAIKYTPFIYTCNHRASGDQLSLKLDFFETSPYTRASDYYMGGGDDVDTLRKIRTKTMHMMIQGDMKMTTSVGLGFPTYFNKNMEFSNRDSIITGTVGNNYAPCISTFLSFYPYSGKNVHWGGTFGIGIPVQGEGTSNLNFFLGGSAVLGSTSKVALHGGLAIGQLPVLTNGMKTGDNLGDEFTAPETKKEFTTGAFFGISFALSK